MFCFWSHGKAKYLVVYSQCCIFIYCQMWGEEGRWQDFIMQRNETHGAAESDTVSKQPGCITAMYSWSERLKWGVRTHSQADMMKGSDYEESCNGNLCCSEGLWRRRQRTHLCFWPTLSSCTLHSSKWAEGFCWSMQCTCSKTTVSEHTDICHVFVIHILIMGCNASNTA